MYMYMLYKFIRFMRMYMQKLQDPQVNWLCRHYPCLGSDHPGRRKTSGFFWVKMTEPKKNDDSNMINKQTSVVPGSYFSFSPKI